MKKIKSKEIIFNYYQIFYLFCFLCGVGVILLDICIIKEIALFFVFGLFLSVLYLFLILINPLYYIFDEEKISIIYSCGIKEVIIYKDIKSILERYRLFRVCCPGYKYFEIYYPHKEKIPLKGEVCKTKKVERLLKYYTNLEIE